jgi:glycosyltransferase involved in cell wall biosynthesis
MNISKPKYSIIIPVYNGLQYLPTCVDTILSNVYDNYELIISDDNSNDGTKDYLDSIRGNNHVRIIMPNRKLSMAEHWEFALSYAKGDWLIFVGQDDGLQHYFFDLSDRLTDLADLSGIRSIASSRAYYFWDGCQNSFGEMALKYRAFKKIKVLNTRTEALKSLLGFQDYFELPQMYTTSLFKRTLIEEAKNLQGGILFRAHPQDANLVAIACSLEKQYLKSFIPLGWVGTSPKSAGMSIIIDVNKVEEKDKSKIIGLRKDYENKVSSSVLGYHKLAGNFSLGNLQIYLWQSFMQTKELRGVKQNKFLISKPFRLILLSFALNTVMKSKRKESIDMMNEVIQIHGFNLHLVKTCSYIARFVSTVVFLLNGIRKFSRILLYKQVYRYIKQEYNRTDTLKNVSIEIKEEITNKYF